MINFIAQRIGIFYKDREWAENLLKSIVADLPSEIIQRKIISKYEMYIQLKEGTNIIFLPAKNTCARAHRFTKIFLEPGIDKEFYDEVIRPYLRHNDPIILNENFSNADLWYKYNWTEEATE